MSPPADPGLPAERTSLAWLRTALAVIAGSLVGLRVLPPQLGPLGYAVSALGVLWGADLVLTARRRHRDGTRMMRAGEGATTAGATLARTAITAGLVAVAALAAVVVLSTR